MYRKNVDSLEGFDRVYNKYLDIDILNPRTHIKKGKAVFTDYEIHVKTNHPEFALKESCVRRRYSEFVWLKQRFGLNDVMMVTAPSLPGKQYIGRFKDEFLMKRTVGLQNFMNKVVEINAFLTEPALHLFLQSNVPVPEMEYHLLHASLLSNVRDIIIQSTEAKRRKERRKISVQAKCDRLRRSLSLDNLPPNQELFKSRQQPDGGRGRGWSRYIGEGYYSIAEGTHDSIDSGSCNADQYRQKCVATTACVLPGGQIRLAGAFRSSTAATASVSYHEIAGSRPSRKRHLSSSWHGYTRDLIDFVLDDYVVISADSLDKSTMSDIESIATTDSPQQEICDSNSSLSSDNGIEVDLKERLKEYNVIASPDNNGLHWEHQHFSLFE